jgi:uncharacterized protein (TIGR02996 family)
VSTLARRLTYWAKAMTQDEVFLCDILGHPDDEGLRLIWADSLDERGDPRAEVIRLQIELTHLPEDAPRRAELQAREQALLAAHREDWVLSFGVVMTWDDALALFRRRLAETVAWCRHRDVPALRTPALEPTTPLAGFVGQGVHRAWSSPSIPERQAILNDLANRRAKLLRADGVLSPAPGGLAGGRLLLFNPDTTLCDEAAVPESEGFFDEHNVPAWDTWVWYVEDSKPWVSGWAMYEWDSYLVAWVPGPVVALADAGIRVNPEECIQWASAVDIALTARLREAGLV